MPDLTALAKNNNGVFPFDRVYQIIDGRREVLAHGPRDMPVWGRNFNMQSSIYFENYPRHDLESNAREPDARAHRVFVSIAGEVDDGTRVACWLTG